jgi:hypothetical protein
LDSDEDIAPERALSLRIEVPDPSAKIEDPGIHDKTLRDVLPPLGDNGGDNINNGNPGQKEDEPVDAGWRGIPKLESLVGRVIVEELVHADISGVGSSA